MICCTRSPKQHVDLTAGAITPAQRVIIRSIALSVVILSALAAPVAAKRRPGTRLDTGYGQPSGVTDWQLQPISSQTIDGVTIRTQVVCPAPDGNVDVDDPTVCHTAYVFLYQLPSGLSNIALTFDSLTGFAFAPGSFGVLQCDPVQGSHTMLCTNNSATDLVETLGLEFSASSGRLTLFVPTVRAGEPLTFYIKELPPTTPARIAPPRLSISAVCQTSRS